MSNFSVQEENPADDDYPLALIKTIRKAQIIVLLVALVSSYIFVTKKLKFKIDITGYLSLLLYLAVTLIRAVFYILDPESGVLDIINSESQILLWYSLYYFELEMLRIKQTIEAASPSEYARIAMRH